MHSVYFKSPDKEVKINEIFIINLLKINRKEYKGISKSAKKNKC